jgi:hypothetical protein
MSKVCFKGNFLFMLCFYILFYRFQWCANKLFLKYANRTFAHFWAHSAIANLQISKFLGCGSPQVENPKSFMLNPQIANQQISKKYD